MAKQQTTRTQDYVPKNKRLSKTAANPATTQTQTPPYLPSVVLKPINKEG